jgi:hypothetical protein
MMVMPQSARAPAPAPTMIISDCVDSRNPLELTTAAAVGGEFVDVTEGDGDLDSDTDVDKLGTAVAEAD